MFLVAPVHGRAYDFEIPEGKIVVFGDSRVITPTERLRGREDPGFRVPANIYRGAAEERPVAVFHAGDIVSMGFARSRWLGGWDVFAEHVRPIVDGNIPFFPAIGNHDYYGIQRHALRNFYEMFPYLSRTFYSVKSGRVLYLLLDSNRTFIAAGGLDQTELAWLEETVRLGDNDPDVKFIVPIFHHPAYSYLGHPSGTGPDSRWVLERFVPVFERSSKVRLVFSGHIHIYERRHVEPVVYVITGGGGSPRHYASDDHLRRRLSGPGQPNPGDVVRTDFHYMRVTPAGDALRVEMIQLDESGSRNVGDSFVVVSESSSAVLPVR